VPSKLPPYQNLSLTNIPGERWKDIPGLEGYFQVSSYGRVKRLEYEMTYKNGAVYVKTEQIIKPAIVKLPNRYKKDDTSFLVARVTLDGIRYNFTVARLVYHCFVSQFDMHDHSLFILAKDTDNFNLRPANLQISTRSDKQRRAVARNRFRSPLLDISQHVRDKTLRKIVASASKQVSQYTLLGRKIRTFKSIAAAGVATGIHPVSIATATSGKGITAGGFAWRPGNATRIDLAGIRQERRDKHRKKYGQKVTQYDMQGNRVAQFQSLQDAQQATGINAGTIRLVLKGIYKSTKGFFWKKGYCGKKIDLSNYKWGKASMAQNQSKSVHQYSLAGKRLRSFKSLKDAALHVGIPSSYISAVVTGRQKTAGGYDWRFA
jgi:hypothetical protein